MADLKPLLILVSSSSFVVVVTLIILAVLGFFNPSVDCEVSEWGPCDPLTGKRKRTIIKQSQGMGKKCGVLEEDCPVNCVTSAWGPCVNDTQTRSVITPSKNGGIACGSLQQSCVSPCDKEGCNARIDDYISKKWAYQSKGDFYECRNCPNKSYPSRLE